MARPFLAPFRRLLRLAGSRWRYSTPPPHGFITPYSQLKVNRRFGGTCHFLLRISRCFVAWLILGPWLRMKYTAPEFRLTFNGLHGDIFQRIELDMFILFISLAYLVFSIYASMFVSNIFKGTSCL
jgi:hypothetical protein